MSLRPSPKVLELFFCHVITSYVYNIEKYFVAVSLFTILFYAQQTSDFVVKDLKPVLTTHQLLASLLSRILSEFSFDFGHTVEDVFHVAVKLGAVLHYSKPAKSISTFKVA